MSTKIVKTLKFPNSSDDYQINAVKLEGKTVSQIKQDFESSMTISDSNISSLNASKLTGTISETTLPTVITIKTWDSTDVR